MYYYYPTAGTNVLNPVLRDWTQNTLGPAISTIHTGKKDLVHLSLGKDGEFALARF